MYIHASVYTYAHVFIYRYVLMIFRVLQVLVDGMLVIMFNRKLGNHSSDEM